MPHFVPHTGEATPRQMLALSAAVNAALRGESASTGTLDIAEGQASATVRDSRCRAGRLALLIPLDEKAAAVRWHLAAMERGSMRFSFSSAPGACRFGWVLTGGA